MTKEEAKEFYPFLQAFAEGRVIECRTKPSFIEGSDVPNDWTEMKEIEFWNNIEYRIKPEPKYRPFKDAEECWKEMQKHRPFGWVKRFGNYTQIITLDNNTITLSNSIGKSSFLSYKDYKQITFADGSVFGVKVED